MAEIEEIPLYSSAEFPRTVRVFREKGWCFVDARVRISFNELSGIYIIRVPCDQEVSYRTEGGVTQKVISQRTRFIFRRRGERFGG